VLGAERGGGGGTLGSSILFEAVLAVRVAELRSVHESRGRGRGRRIEAAARPPACPVCAAGTAAASRFVGTALSRAAEPSWQDALGSAAFCLDHFVLVMAAARPSDEWRAIEARQLARVEALRARIESFAHRSAHDRRHLITDEERRSADEAAALLGGGRGS
jgi:hypothetical protein